MKRMSILMLFMSAAVQAAPQPAKPAQKQEPQQNNAPAQPAPRQPQKCERAAWSCDRDYEHYIQNLRDYADALKDDMSVLGRSEFERITKELALIAVLKQQAAAEKSHAPSEQELLETARKLMQNPAQELPIQQTKQDAPGTLPTFTLVAFLGDGRKICLYCKLAGQTLHVEHVEFLP